MGSWLAANGPVGPLAAYLRALEAGIGVLERRSSAVPLMTAADAARYARVNVETMLRAVRGGEVPVAGYVGRSPRISRDALNGGLATRSPSAPPVARQPVRVLDRPLPRNPCKPGFPVTVQQLVSVTRIACYPANLGGVDPRRGGGEL